MGIQLLSKTNTGIISTLFLVVLLSQSQIFNFLIDTIFGRTILIFCILGISYAHKYLGLFVALLIILLLNHYDLSYFEGFDENRQLFQRPLLMLKKTFVKHKILLNQTT